MKNQAICEQGEFLEELRQLACLVSGKPDLNLVEGPARSGWSFSPSSRTISMDAQRLRSESRDFNRGLLLHEGAHAAITRLSRLTNDPFLRRPDIFGVINAIEDCRIETWLMERLPGSKPWISEYNTKLIGNDLPDARQLPFGDIPPVHGLAFAIVAVWWHGLEAVKLPAGLASLLLEVQPFIERICKAIPLGKAPPGQIKERYERCGLDGDRGSWPLGEPGDVWEMEVRLTQAQMWAEFEAGILPVLRRIVPPPHNFKLPASLERWFRSWSMERHAGPEDMEGGLPLTAGGTGTFAGRGLHDSFPWDPNPVEYQAMACRQGAAIERLGAEVLRLIQPTTRRRWEGPFNGGIRVCLRSIIRAEGDPRRDGLVWQRQSIFQRRDPHFVVLVDRSSSMAGETIRATAEGVVLLAEVCGRCGIDLGILTFSSGCDVVAYPEAGLDPRALGLIGGLPAAAEGGTRIDLGLRGAREQFVSSETRERFLVVLSDGEYEPDEDVDDQLRRIRGDGIHLLGLGIGPGTEGLARMIPNSRTGLSPAQIPAAFSDLLVRSLAP